MLTKEQYLIFVPPNSQFPFLTVSLQIKWYCFYLITDEGEVKEIPFEYDSHIPSLEEYEYKAEVLNAYTSEFVSELIVGRRVLAQ